MLDIKYIRENPDKVRQNALNKGVEVDIDKLLDIDRQWRAAKNTTQGLQHFHNGSQAVVSLFLSSIQPDIETTEFWKSLDARARGLFDDQEKFRETLSSAAVSFYAALKKQAKDAFGPADSPIDPLEKVFQKVGSIIKGSTRTQKDIETLLSMSDELIQGLSTLSDIIKDGESFTRNLKTAIDQIMLQVPNIAMEDVPVGGEDANKLLREWGEEVCRVGAKAHWDIGESLGVLDTKLAAKLAGSNFALFLGAGAKLVRALMQFMLDTHSANGYVEVWPPVLANREIMTGTGQLPKFEHEMYRFEKDDLFLIPTAEVPLTALHAGEILPFTDLPLNYCAYTPCFRREAGAYGSGTRGLLRVHQFDKVEILKVTTPEQSAEELEKLLADAEHIIRKLGLRYRVALLSTGEMTFASERTYDIEIWSPGVKRWLEVSSVSSFGDFQARRLGVRYRDKDRKVRFCHTMNGSGVAFARLIACLLETYQQDDGSVEIPEALRPFFGAGRIEKG